MSIVAALPGRPFEHVLRLSHGVPGSGNLLIQGENLAVLEDLRAGYEGRVRCIYIDPPYNNQETYNHYSDTRSHDGWLEMMEPRLRLLRAFLSDSGSLWISIDDREVHYLKVAVDRIFGRENFVTTIVWQQRTTRENRKVFSNNHEYLLVYALNAKKFQASRNLLPAPQLESRYKNPDKDPRGPWQSISANAQAGHATASQFYDLVAPNGTRHRPPEGRCWIYTRERMQAEIASGNVWFGKDGRGVPRLKRFLSSATLGLTPETLWLAESVGTTDGAKKQQLQMFPDQPVFDTPKPEALLERVIQIATNPGDLVLDAFLGSGTTSAVALKTGRRFIGIERGQQAVTHCAERLRRMSAADRGNFDFYRHRG